MDGNIQIKSVKTYGDTDEEREANAVPAAWKTQIQVDTDADGTPDSWIDLADAIPEQRPAWMPADFPTGGTPEGTGFYEVPAVKMTTQPVMSHEERLRTAWTEEIAEAYRNPSNRFDEDSVPIWVASQFVCPPRREQIRPFSLTAAGNQLNGKQKRTFSLTSAGQDGRWIPFSPCRWQGRPFLPAAATIPPRRGRDRSAGI